jgi:hypothetical protein
MSIKNNYKSKFLSVYLSTKPTFFVGAFLLIFLFNGFFAKSIAQQAPPLTIQPESYYQELEKYSQIKDSLPFYFFTYCLGGQLRNETEPTYQQLLARQYIIAMPVLISGNENIKPFELWRTSIIYARTKQSNFVNTEEKLAYEKRLDPNNKSIATSEQEAIAIKNALKGLPPEQVSSNKDNKDSEKSNTKDSASKNKKNKNGSKDSPDAKGSNAEQQIYDPIPLAIKAKMLEMGEENAWEWLYNQQIIAGNVLYCHPQTLIPKSVGISNSEDVEVYSKVIAFWKKAYRKVLAEKKFPEYDEITNKNLSKENLSFAKSYLLNDENLNFFSKQYSIELQKAPPIEIKPEKSGATLTE